MKISPNIIFLICKTYTFVATIKMERQVASILVIKRRVSEAQEIERRIASMAEVVFDEGEE